MLTLAWLVVAHAHGPAPVALEVLSWDADDACEDTPEGATPALVRTNIGLARHLGDGTYAYGCPTRWGGFEQALALAHGDELLLAGSTGMWRSTDAGCHAEPVDLPSRDVVLAMASWRGAAWVLTRDFVEGSGGLWRFDGGRPTPIQAFTDGLPDGLWADGDALWLAGATPDPWVAATLDGETLEPAEALPDVDDVERLVPRWTGEPDRLHLIATVAGERWLWSVGPAGPEVEVGPAVALHGPVGWGDVGLVLADGVAHGIGGEPPIRDEDALDWTCLGELDGRSYACSLDGVRVAVDGGVQTAFVMEQLGPPDPDCAARDGSCDLDWRHFGGESGWVETAPATCPSGERTPLDTEPADEPEVPCGCSHGGTGAGWALGVGLALCVRRRRGAW